jgi:probable HAF family extracellular repeat protein
MKLVKRLGHFAAMVILSSVALSVSEPASTETRYRITDLGDLPGGSDHSAASGISESGLVVGWSEAESGTRAFLWHAGVMTDLGDLPGGVDESAAWGVNDAAQVVGRSVDDVQGRAFLWETGVMSSLGALPGGSGNSEAHDINGAGRAVGYSVGTPPEGGVSAGQATLWETGDGAIEGLGDLPGGSYWSMAWALNDSGQVVGESEAASGTRAFLWERGSPMIDLGDLPGGIDYSVAYDINNAGLVVGDSQAAEGQRAFLWRSGVMTNLGDLGGPLNRSWASAINDAGQIVGTSNNRRGGDAGFIWDAENGMRDLNDLIDPNDPILTESSHVFLSGATDINEAGQIVGMMYIGVPGTRHAYLLSPVEYPSPVPDIKVNGSDGPLTLSADDHFRLSLHLNNNERNDVADWWLIALSPYGILFWTPTTGWTYDWLPGYQGPLYYLREFSSPILPVRHLARGRYRIIFGVDLVMNGVITRPQAYWDFIDITVVP